MGSPFSEVPTLSQSPSPGHIWVTSTKTGRVTPTGHLDICQHFTQGLDEGWFEINLERASSSEL